MSSRELKYVFPCFAKQSILTDLNSTCIEDQEYSHNTICSLYFDTNDYLLAMEKADSDYCKSKVRIRWYTTKNNNKPTRCWLEIKNKLGSTRTKHRRLMPEPLNIVLQQLYQDPSGCHASNAFIRQQIAKHSPELISVKLQPVFTVSYQRHRFYDPFSMSRIAFDSEVCSTVFRNSNDFVVTHAKLDELILEVKGQYETLPYVLRPLAHKGLKKAAFSKYYQCFNKLSAYTQ